MRDDPSLTTVRNMGKMLETAGNLFEFEVWSVKQQSVQSNTIQVKESM
jgi:hypothetical protein